MPGPHRKPKTAPHTVSGHIPKAPPSHVPEEKPLRTVRIILETQVKTLKAIYDEKDTARDDLNSELEILERAIDNVEASIEDLASM